MLIYAQDRRTVINLDVTPFLATHPTRNEIYCGVKENKGVLIGKYATEERTAEVLENIWEHYLDGVSYIMPIE